MPAVPAGDQTTLHTFPQGTKLGMAIFQPETIVTGRVSGSPATGATTVVLTSKVEDEAPEANFTVYAGSAAGLSDGGKVRLKSLSGSTMTLAPNFVQWTTYDYITIKKVIEPWAILPDIENDFEDEDVPYTNQNDEYHPLGRVGPLGIVGTTSVAVKMWSDSTGVGGASVSSHAWVFPDGSPGTSSSAGSSGSPISVTWSTATGHTPKYVKYTVTDSNGKTHVRRVPVWIFDDIGDSYCDFELESCSGNFDSGSWRASIKALGDADIAMFPEDAMIVVFAEDHYAGHRTELGGNWTHQENIVFAGWIATDSVQRDKDLGFVTFEVLGPVDKMKELLCWPANLERKSSPDTWHELRAMTSDLAAFHVWTEHTTMEAICDFKLTGNTKKFLYVDIPEADPHSQIQDYCLHPIGANLLSDRQGRVYLDLNPNRLPVGDRSGIATVISLTIDSPIRNDPGLTLAIEDHAEDVAQVDFVAFGYTGEDPKPYYSLAPGNQHTQSESNTLSGLYLAEFNNIWREVKIPLFNWRVFDIAPQEYTELTLVAADTKRGLVWNAQKLICRSVEIAYEPPVNDGGGVSPIPVLPPTSAGNPRDLLIGDDTNGVWWLPVGGSLWVDRSSANKAVEQVGWDPWWFTEQKKASGNPEEAIIWSCHAGAIYVSDNLGNAWVLASVGSDPPNSWGDATAPTFADLTFVQRTDNIHQNKAHYFTAEWQNGFSEWRGWILYTLDDGATWAWVPLDPVLGATEGNYVYPTSIGATVGTVTGASNILGPPDGTFAEFAPQSGLYFNFPAAFSWGGTNTMISGGKKTGYGSECRVSPDGIFGGPGTFRWYRQGTDPDDGSFFTRIGNPDHPGYNTSLGFAKHWGFSTGTGWIDYVGVNKSLFSSADYRPIWMDVDSESGGTLYLTAWKSTDVLVLQIWDIATMKMTSETSLGACTIGELNAGTYVAYPYTPTFTANRVYAFGRMTAPAGLAGVQHLIQSTDGGSAFTSAESGLGTSVLTNFRAEGEADGARTFYGIVSASAAAPQFYRGAETLASISTLSDLPNGLVNIDAFAIRIPPEGGVATIGVGSNAAQAIMVLQSEDDGATWADITLNLPTTGAIKTCVFV